MPGIGAQLDAFERLPGSMVLARLMIPPGRKYEDMRDAYTPFDRIHEVRDDMRDDVVRLVRAAADQDVDAYVIANNKAEGSSPLTIRGLAERLANP
jgi:hypothetical protein